MKTVANYLMPLGFLICTACSTSLQTEDNARANAPAPHQEDTLSDKQYRWKRDLKTIEYCESIRATCHLINKKHSLLKVDSIEVRESTEGGFVKYFSNEIGIVKIEEAHYGETGFVQNKYYFDKQNLLYVQEKNVDFKTVYADPELDVEKFDTLVEDTYFKHGCLFDYFHNDDCGAPDAPEVKVLKEKELLKRIKELKALTH